MPRQFRMPGAGYTWTGHRLEEFYPYPQWVVVREDLQRSGEGVIVPDKKHAVRGTVVSAGDLAVDEGIDVGDVVYYEEWQGGRWSFEDPEGDDVARVLIMSVDAILCKEA